MWVVVFNDLGRPERIWIDLDQQRLFGGTAAAVVSDPNISFTIPYRTGPDQHVIKVVGSHERTVIQGFAAGVAGTTIHIHRREGGPVVTVLPGQVISL